MKIRVHCNLGTKDFPDAPLTEGEHEVDDKFGAKLVGLKLATDITPPQPIASPGPVEEVAAAEPPKLDRFEQMRSKNKTQASK